MFSNELRFCEHGKSFSPFEIALLKGDVPSAKSCAQCI